MLLRDKGSQTEIKDQTNLYKKGDIYKPIIFSKLYITNIYNNHNNVYITNNISTNINTLSRDNYDNI